MKKYVLFVVAALTAVLAVLGLTSSGASASTRVVPTESFVFVATGANDNPLVLATGPIHARGVDHSLSASVDRLSFRRGDLILRHRVTSGSSVNTFDRTTCYGTHQEDGTYAFFGDRGYRGVSGFGRYHLEVDTIGCNPRREPRLFILRINASGPIRVPVAAH